MELGKVNCWSNTYLRCDFIIFSPGTCSWGWVFGVTPAGRYTAGCTDTVCSRKAQAYRLIHGGFSWEQTHLVFSPYTSYLAPLIPLPLSWIMSALIAASPSIFPTLARYMGRQREEVEYGMAQPSINQAKKVQVKLSQSLVTLVVLLTRVHTSMYRLTGF